ncbi:glycosyltransferase family 2 protein [Gallalistipes aquisgranensis]|uniref:glycosyltransferase family 2 protein n=1 Tax=Gallalistipes aquisgranensis TaxID=2779358 RepID=UPI001CF8A4A0|nr:glycosyltransferase family 2 protein [Gallalistipes aquisgranensis]MBE5032846.1 glycosyltransferase family 2 protein [Gallalistipes aquisgranensis]
MPVVKVVILNWNGEEHLRRFLPSVVDATPAEAEIVVADNGSTDGSLVLLRERFPGVTLLLLDRNYGYAEGYNRALAQLEADYFVLLNSDVETPRGWLGPLVERMESDPSIVALAPKLLAYGDRGRFEYAGASGGFLDMLGYPFCRGRILSTLERDEGQYDTAREVFWASGACMVVRAGMFRELGGFDGKFFAHMEEIDLCWRAQLRGYRVWIEPRSRVWHLGGGTLPNNTPRKIYLNYRNNLAMLYKNLPAGRVEAILFLRMVLDGLSALVFLLQGRPDFFREVFRAHMDFHRRRGELREQRRRIQDGAVASPRMIYGGSIILRYLLGKRRFGTMM